MQLFRRIQDRILHGPALNSMAKRIRWVYSIILLLVLVGLVMQALDLRGLAWQLEINTATNEFVDGIREIRRIEKNWFLSKKSGDLLSLKEASGRFLRTLENHREDYREVSPEVLLDDIEKEARSYRSLLESVSPGDKNESFSSSLRNSGRTLAGLVQQFQNVEQASIQARIETMTWNALATAILMIFTVFLLGRLLIRSVVQPLSRIVDYTEQISLENYQEGWRESDIQEVDSLIRSLNRMVKRIKEKEEQVRQHTKMATLGTLVAGVAHELNNPLSNISSSAQILLEESKESHLSEESILPAMTARIIDQTDRAMRIVRSLLEFSREREILVDRISLPDFFSEVMQMVRGENRSGVLLDPDSVEDCIFLADRQRLQQVLINLLLNAIHAVGESGKVTLRGQSLPDGRILITVADNGAGIPEEIQNKIFDPFFTTKDVGEGFGLGLAISREIVEKHGGQITVESRVGEGTVFRLFLPSGGET